MASTLRISELAARSGFTPSTLRYYEQVGLLGAADRSPAGYRLYDDAAVTRLRLVGRAKKLGLPLDEIRDLMAVWDGGSCSHVQERLRSHTAAKSAQVRSRIAELTSFAAQLDRAQDELAATAGDGPCGDTCACTDSAGPPAPRLADLRPAGGVALACTLDVAARPDRLAEWHAALEVAVQREIDGGLRFTFGPDPGLAARLADLAAREQACCAFFVFTLRLASEGLTLDIQAPPDAIDMLRSAFAGAA